VQTYRWQDHEYNISQLLADIDAGGLRPALIDLTPEFVGRYGQVFLVRGEAGRFAVNTFHVLTHSQSKIHEPAVLLHVGDDAGLITFNEEQREGANWVIGDGNHRILAAGLEGIGMKAYCLTREETQRYEMDNAGGRAS
jgi:hypothetical protein